MRTKSHFIPLFFTVLIISLLCGAEVDLFIPSFPEIRKVFALSPFQVQLTLSANFLAYSMCSLFAGCLGDRFNRRVVILISLSIFVIASLFCVFATCYSMLVLGRFFQGVGMAAPSILSYLIIIDTYPLKKQMALVGLLNGVVTISMAFAPVIGSYVNMHFDWRANFIVLLGLGVLALVSSYMFIPNHRSNTAISLSVKAYIPLLTSNKLMIFITSLSLLGVAYWVFIGMAPILYMESFGVDLNKFGYYQGSIALAFGLVNILSPKIIGILGLERCLLYSLALCLMGALAMLFISVLHISSPLSITVTMAIISVAAVFPVQSLFPITLQVIANSSGKISALLNSTRLLLTAILLEIIGYFYVGDFFLLGITIVIVMVVSLLLIMHMIRNKWLPLT